MRNYTVLTTMQLNEIRRLNAEGENDVNISRALGVPYKSVYRHRHAMGLPRSHRNKKTYTYTVYDAKTDRLVAFGTVEDCVKAMGFKKNNSFYKLVSHAMNGKQKKYSILREAIEEA